MMPNATKTPARDVVVVERSPFSRMAFIGQATRMTGEMFLHDDLVAGLASLKTVKPATLFVSRQLLMETTNETLQDLVGAMVGTRVRVVVLCGRNEPHDVGGRMAVPVEWFLVTPFPPEVMLQLAQGLVPQDEGAIRAAHTRNATPTNWTPHIQGPHATPPLGVVATSTAVNATPPGGVPARTGAQLADELRRDRLMLDNVERMDHFEVLGVTGDAPRRELLSAYLALVRRFHPDLAATLTDVRLATEIKAVYRRITDAWTVLGNDEKRQAYRMNLMTQGRRGGTGLDASSRHMAG